MTGRTDGKRPAGRTPVTLIHAIHHPHARSVETLGIRKDRGTSVRRVRVGKLRRGDLLMLSEIQDDARVIRDEGAVGILRPAGAARVEPGAPYVVEEFEVERLGIATGEARAIFFFTGGAVGAGDDEFAESHGGHGVWERSGRTGSGAGAWLGSHQMHAGMEARLVEWNEVGVRVTNGDLHVSLRCWTGRDGWTVVLDPNVLSWQAPVALARVDSLP